MQAPERSSAPHRVRDPAAAALLRDPSRWKFFTSFIRAESSMSGAARRAGVSLRDMYTFVQKGLRLGLLEPTRVEARKGRPIRFYRAVAEKFFVAYEDMSAPSLEDDLLESWRYWEREVYRATARHFEEVFAHAELNGSGPWGRLYGRAEGGEFSQLTLASEKGLTKEPEVWRAQGVTPFVVGRGVLKLSYEQVRAVQRWVDALERDVFAEEGAERYFVEMILVKLPEEP